MKTRISTARAKQKQSEIAPRKTPIQARANETVAAILEASAHILERHGFEGFNTNAIAERAGVSIGSLYQYFPNKDALLSGLIDRETEPLLVASAKIRGMQSFAEGLHSYIQASIRHQMERPRLAMLIDVAEMRDVFQIQVASKRSHLQSVVKEILFMPGGFPTISSPSVAGDLLAILRTLIDAAGERGESASPELILRVEGAVRGYLEAICSLVAEERPSL